MVECRSFLLLAALLVAGCSSPNQTPEDRPADDPAPRERPADGPVADAPWEDATQGLQATVVLVADEVAQGKPVLAAYVFSSDPAHPWFGEQPLAQGRAKRMTKRDLQDLFVRLEGRGMFGLPWWDQPAEGPGELAAGLYVWDGPERLMVLREGLTEAERATLYACELELRGLSGHKGWNDTSEGRAQTLIYVTRVGNREDARPAAIVFSSDPENPYFNRTSTEQVTVKRLRRAEYSELEGELNALGLAGLPWKPVELEGAIGPERALYLQEGGVTRRVLKDALHEDGPLKVFSAIERRLIRVTMSKQ